MSDNQCPNCDRDLDWQGHYYCGSCEIAFDKIGYCPSCDDKLEKLQACGAANYFCNSCNELQSKSRVRFEFVPKVAS